MISLENVSKGFGDKTILDNTNFLFPVGKRIGLVGPNGAGKTTLLNILCRIEEADSGKVLYPSNSTLGYLPQEPNPTPCDTVLEEAEVGADALIKLRERLSHLVQKMNTDHSDKLIEEHERLENEFRQKNGYALEANAKSILSGLGFPKEMLTRSPKDLSGGWRMRLELAKIFIKEPDFLILDEPTNHLDLPSLMWVEKYLKSFKGTLLFVSHDRSLLEKLANHTILLGGGQIESYPHSFSLALEKREEKIAQEAAQIGNILKKRKHMEDFVTRFGAKATKARQAQSRVKMIAKLDAKIDYLGGSTMESGAQSMSFSLPEPMQSGREVMDVQNLAIGYDKPLASELNLTIERGQKVAIIGANGIGKSTFLKSITGYIPNLGGQVEFGHNVDAVYFSQNHEDTLDFDSTCVDNVLSGNSKIGVPEARSVLGAFLFSGDDTLKKVSVLSGGEKSRVALAKVLVSKGNFLLLDEPTNHLDMSSVDALIETIRLFKGTILFVSHDRNFIDSVCSHIFVMLPDGRSRLFEGKLADYESMAKVQGFPNVLDPDEFVSIADEPNKETKEKANTQAQSRLSYTESKELKRKIQSSKRRLQKIESEQEALQLQKETITAQLTEISPSDFEAIQAKSEELQRIETEIEQCEESWLEESETLDDLTSE
ncbi:MAG: ABC-F family ATP-binding cassette domain-containing protein [Pseudobacteriovorax sp.]|nr:ABC-F family ATP-binding cassette domain-containing protein [Pseudobacteriovorax sp.]